MTRHGLPPLQRVWVKVDRSDISGCWPFMGSRSGAGHGRIKVNLPGTPTRLAQAHRVVYEAAFGPIPPGLVVRHSCDNPPCCRPAHLAVGTQADNVRDMCERGRHGYGVMRGEANPRARLCEKDVRQIREMRVRGAMLREIAARFSISVSQTRRVCTGESWQHSAALGADLAGCGSFVPAAHRTALTKLELPDGVTR